MRNKQRSLATVLSVGLGMAAMLFLWSYNDSTILDMKRNTTDFITGHLQIGPKGYAERPSLSLGLSNGGFWIEGLQADPEVEAASGRLRTQALVGLGERSQGVHVIGVDPAAEAKTTRIPERIEAGTYLSGGKKEIILGHYLAKKLRAKPGDRVVLMARDAYGMSMGYAFEVTGIYKLGDRFSDERCAYADLATLQEMLDNDAKVSEIAVRLKNVKSLERYAAGLSDRFRSDGVAVNKWYEVAPEADQFASWGNAIFFIVMIVLVVVIAMGIMNSILMSVFERTKEFGVMLAVGTRPSELIGLVLIETALLEFFGIAVGMALGCGLIRFFGTFGISLKNISDALEQNFMSSVIYTSFSPERTIQSFLVLAAVTGLAVIYPMVRVGRLEPVKAIYRS